MMSLYIFDFLQTSFLDEQSQQSRELAGVEVTRQQLQQHHVPVGGLGQQVLHLEQQVIVQVERKVTWRGEGREDTIPGQRKARSV